MSPNELVNQRRHAGTLIQHVLDEWLTPAQALTRWPDAPDDPTLDAAYQALWHLEADETEQQQEVFYLDAQLELLKQMSRVLARGEALPGYITGRYSPEHRVRYYVPVTITTYWRHVFTEAWSQFLSLYRQALEAWQPGQRRQRHPSPH